ncbi:MAG: hypothetical protein RIC55_27000 [Pirellulaceae bacterium]
MQCFHRWGRFQRATLVAVVLVFGVVALTMTGLAKRLLTGGGEVAARPDGDMLVVHEWGTFTAIQDADGAGLTGVNTDDEPVPEFVHRLSDDLLVSTFNTGKPRMRPKDWSRLLSKGLPRFAMPMVTMRLETPVIYFHPPDELQQPLSLDVEVGFRGGWLSEFYPNADSTAPGLAQGLLTEKTIGKLSWTDLKIGTEADGPQTDEPVWLEPRDVDAANVTTADGESERYLFYRGVGRFEAPLRVATDEDRNLLTLHGRFDDVPGMPADARIPNLWLVEVGEDGEVAYRTIGAIEARGGDKPLATVSTAFCGQDFQQENFDVLRRDMHAALVADGLYADEADAMLDTWRQAYFRNPGLRLFFLVPQAWTDDRLPLSISQPAQIDRVMMARIEIISDRQRRLVREIAQADSFDPAWVDEIPVSENRARFLAGDSDFGPLGVEIPAEYQAYLDLGRFRNAILLAEERRNPSKSLTNFINSYHLRPTPVLTAQTPVSTPTPTPTPTTASQ